MLIQVSREWRIQTCEQTWNVERLSGSKRGKAKDSSRDDVSDRKYKWVCVAFCSSLESAVQTLYEHRVRRIEGSDLEKIIDAVNEIKSEIRPVLRKLDLIN
ncbi:MAG: hypothetical protein ABIH23_16330 [bacterium]